MSLGLRLRKKAERNRVYPEPGILGDKGAGWKIEDSPHAHVLMDQRKLYVPLDKGDLSQWIRTHELAHIKFSPDTNVIEGIPQEIILAVEDMRMNKIIKCKGIPIPDAGNERSLRNDLTPLDLLLMSVCAVASPHEREAWEILNLEKNEDKTLASIPIRTVLERAGNIMDRDIFDFGSTEAVCRYIYDMISVPKDRGDLDPMLDYAHHSDGEGEWGTMNLKFPPLVVTQKGYLIKSTRCTDEGVMLRSPDRLLIDQKIFGMRKRIKGGTVLIDASGSMSLSPRDIKGILNGAPNATVYIYGADHYSSGDCVLIAKGGRMVKEEHMESPGGANTIDGPCLEYISHLPKPRVWVSDGVVTGTGDRLYANLTREAMQTCLKAQIYRVSHVSEVTDALKELSA